MFSRGPRCAEHDGVVRIARKMQKVPKQANFKQKVRILCMKDDFLTYEVAFVGVFWVKYVSVVYQNVRLGELSLVVQRSARDSMTLATKARKFVSGPGEVG